MTGHGRAPAPSRGLSLLWCVVLVAACGEPPAPPPALTSTAVASPTVPPPPSAPPPAPRIAPKAAEPVVVFETPGGEVPVVVEVARTEAERRQGLMGRRHLPPGRGMLFLMDTERIQVFWMKNTLIPLDMIFVNEAMEVVGVVESATPLTETGRGVGVPSRWVVEIPGGHARAAGIAPGARVRVVGVPDFPPAALPVDGD
jgi:uncharacterized membrane protein (UPF0127 family)